MIYFLDASALVKRYLREPGSDAVRSLVRRRRELAVSRISAAEVPAALARRARDRSIPLEIARSHAAQLRADLTALRVVELRPAVIDLAAELAFAHPLRAYDTVQLASALVLARATGLAVTFVCADVKLTACAAAERLRVRRLT